MEKVKNALKSSTRIIIIALIILVLIFLSFFMVKLVPRILSSMANSTVSITSAFFPSENTNTSTSSGVSLNTTATNTSTSTDSFLTNFFGPRKVATSSASYSIATSTRQESNNQVNTSNNVRTYNDRNTNYGTPDLAVTITSIGISTNGVFVATNNFTTADTVIVKFKIENQGTAPTGSWSMKVNMPSSNVSDQIKTISSGSLPAGTAVSGQAVFNTPAFGSNQKVTISVDPNGAILESNKNNNQASVALNVTQTNNYYNNNYNNNYNNGYNYNYNNNYNYNCVNGYTNGVYTNCNMSYTNNTPNLTIRQVALGKTDIYNQFTPTTYLRASEKVAVKFEVTNNSSVYTSSWTWKAQIVGPNPYAYNYSNYNSYNNGYTYNSDGSRTYNPTVVESGLAPGETRTYTATFDGLTNGSNYITIIVDSANNIIETNEGDNTITQSFFVNY